MSARLMLCAALTLGFTLGCMGGEEATVETPEAKASPEDKAGAIAKAIAADASKLDDALKEQGMSADEFEALMFDIAKDPKRTDAYLDARK